MKKAFQTSGVCVAALAVALPFGLMGQTPAAQPPSVQGAPVTVQGAPATVAAAPAQPAIPEDALMLQQILQTPVASVADVDKRLASIDEFVIKFPTSQYKGYAFSSAAQASQMKGAAGRDRAIFYYKQAVAADPKDHLSMLMLAAETAQGTEKFDIKKDEKLDLADKMVNDAMALIPTSVKPNPTITDEQWAAIRKDDTAQAYEAKGLIAMAREKYNDAATDFRMSIDTASNKSPATYVRLGGAYNEAKKYDEATKILDEVIAMPGVPDQIKSVAEAEKKRTQQLRGVK